MEAKRRASVTRIVVATIVAMTSIVLLAIALIYFALNRNYEITQIKNNVMYDADKLASSLEMPLWNLDEEQIRILLESEFKNQAIEQIVLHAPLVSLAYSRNSQNVVVSQETTPEVSLIHEVRSISHAGQNLGELTLDAGFSPVMARIRENFLFFLALIVILELLLVSSLYVILRMYILRPIKELERYVGSVERDEKAQEFVVKGRYAGELASLRTSIEKMVQLLEERYQSIQRAMAELSENRNFLDSVLQNIPDMVLVKDASTLTYVEINRVGQELLGLSMQELEGKNDFNSFPKKQAELFTEWDRETLSRGTMLEIPEERIHTRFKGERILHTRKIPVFDSEGREKYIIEISNDITDKIDAERKLRELNADLARRVEERTNALKNLNEDLESFNYSVSHDLRTPLRAINGFTQIVLDEYRSVLGDEGARKLMIVIESVNKMDLIISGLLSLARFSKADLSPSMINMTELAREVCDERLTASGAAADEFMIDIAPLPPVEADASLIREALGQIVENAIKFSKSAPAKEIYIRGSVAGAHCVYTIQDSGPGFSAEFSKNLFRAFERLHDSRTYGGVGVGLAIARIIVEKHGGHVEAESEQGRGATFSITLPSRQISR